MTFPPWESLFLALVTSTGDPDVEFDIPNMTCGHCAGTVKKAIEHADPTASSIIDVGNKKANVETSLSPEAMIALNAAWD
ncbi:heavy-metal-associated domain-containing protein [Rhizobium sp.]|uniref:heavy-metal-associated domain-containing protein n=1 Tax=Rhizobium sp. TaxID=391 RepID=UPI00289FC7B4